jgi:hypothetical protein
MASLFPEGWQEMALQSGAFERLREFPSPGVLLRTLLLHVARGYSLRETVLRAKLAHWADVSDVALLKRLRNSEDWLRSLCVELLRENGGNWSEEAASPRIRIVDGTNRQKTREDGEPVADTIQPATAESEMRLFRANGNTWRRYRRILEPPVCAPAGTYSCGCWLLLDIGD